MNVWNCAHSISKLAGHASLSDTVTFLLWCHGLVSGNGTIGTLCSTHTHTVHIQYTERVSRGVCHNVLFSHLHTEDAGALIIAQGGTG